MIKKIRIKNFKCYGPKGADFNLAKINFIFGDNSAGKSTFLQFLQKVADQLDTFGSFDSEEFNRHLFRGESQKVEALFRVSSTMGGESKDEVWTFRCPESGNEYEMISNGDKRRITRKDLDTILPVPKGAHHIIHKEALRIHGGQPHKSLGELKMENIVNVESNDLAIDYLDDIFERLEIPYCCVSSGDGIHDKYIRDLDFDMDIPLEDVGTGINGLVHLAFDLQEWQSGILELEEPETNVNEEHMAPLAKVLVEEALKRESGQLIVECHSKLMAIQLAALVRDGTLSYYGKGGNEEPILSVIEVIKRPEGSTAEPVYISPNGEIDWPTGFFPAERKLLQKILGV